MEGDEVVRAARELARDREDLLRDVDVDLPEQLIERLDQADRGDDVTDEIVDLLAGDPRTRAALSERLQALDNARGADDVQLPGRADPSDAIWYACPTCDYRYPVFELGEDVPPCPHGHGPLRRV